MSLQGKIINISDDGKKARVLVKPSINCNGCKVCAGLIKSSKVVNSECEVEAFTNELQLKQGDLVKLELSELQGSKVAFIIYGIPILFFLLGMILTPYICGLIKIEVTDFYRIIGAFLGLTISYIIILCISKYSKSDNFIMSITEIC